MMGKLLSKMTTDIMVKMQQELDHATRLTEVEPVVEAVLAAPQFAHMKPAVRSWLSHRRGLLLTLEVERFADALPVLEFIEAYDLGVLPPLLFTESGDWPSMGNRDFYSWGITVEAAPRFDAKGCRRVIKGFSPPTPIYEFECDGEAA